MPEPEALSALLRRAVYLDDCETHGHTFEYKHAVGLSDVPNPNNQGNWPNYEVESGEQGRLPYIRCSRCGSVWIVIDEPGFGYDDALRKVRKRMGSPADPTALQPKPRQERRRQIKEMLLDERRKVRRQLRAEFSENGAMSIRNAQGEIVDPPSS